jgi:hypothetical protein
MTKSSPLKTPKIHQINFQKLSEINRATGTEPSPDSFSVGESAVDLQVNHIVFYSIFSVTLFRCQKLWWL